MIKQLANESLLPAALWEIFSLTKKIIKNIIFVCVIIINFLKSFVWKKNEQGKLCVPFCVLIDKFLLNFSITSRSVRARENV